MNRTLSIFVLLLALTVSAKAQQRNSTAARPNIILFFVDDMGWQDTSVPFWTEKTPLNLLYHTPNMEKMAAEGMKFTQAYASSVCSPTRVSLMTGMNAARHRVTNWTLKRNISDTGNKAVIGGLSREFYHRVWLHYKDVAAWNWQNQSDFGNKGQGTVAMDGEFRTMWLFEPHVAEKVFEDFVKENNIKVLRGEWLDRNKGVVKKKGEIISFSTLSGKVFKGKIFIDATYEGDLMAAAGINFHVGREGNLSITKHLMGFKQVFFNMIIILNLIFHPIKSRMIRLADYFHTFQQNLLVNLVLRTKKFRLIVLECV